MLLFYKFKIKIMSQNENVETIDLKSFIKGQASLKATNLTKIAEKLGKKQSSLSGLLIRKKINVETLIDILDVIEEDLVLVLKNGNQFKIKL